MWTNHSLNSAKNDQFTQIYSSTTLFIHFRPVSHNFLVKIWSNLAKTDPFFSLRRQVNEAERQAKRVNNFVISLKNQELLVIRLFGPDTFIIFLSFFLGIPLFGAIWLLGTWEYPLRCATRLCHVTCAARACLTAWRCVTRLRHDHSAKMKVSAWCAQTSYLRIHSPA